MLLALFLRARVARSGSSSSKALLVQMTDFMTASANLDFPIATRLLERLHSVGNGGRRRHGIVGDGSNPKIDFLELGRLSMERMPLDHRTS